MTRARDWIVRPFRRTWDRRRGSLMVCGALLLVFALSPPKARFTTAWRASPIRASSSDSFSSARFLTVNHNGAFSGNVNGYDVREEGVMIFPLVPHQVQERRYRHRRHRHGRHRRHRRRRLLERRDDDEKGANLRPIERPHRYWRLLHLDEQIPVWNGSHYLRPRPHDDRRGRRRLGRRDGLTVGALYQGYGTHYADLWVGSPSPQRQTVIVDTGSGVTAFPCSGCRNCGKRYHIDELFVENRSDTFHKMTCTECVRGDCHPSGLDFSYYGCRIGMGYQEGSNWTAYEASDITYIGGPHLHGLESRADVDPNGLSDLDPQHAGDFAFRMLFACQTDITGLFVTQMADGILGVDQERTSFWSQLHGLKKVKHKRFSLCYSRQPIASKNGTEAGAMTLGGYDNRLHTSPMVFASSSPEEARKKQPFGMAAMSNFYPVMVRKLYMREGGGGDSALSTNPDLRIIPIEVGGKKGLFSKPSVMPEGTVIIDSGTTDTFFSKHIGPAFNRAFAELTGGREYSHNPIVLSIEELHALPTILIQLAGDAAFNQYLFKDKDASKITGLARALDPDHPYDVVLAMPPSHYMEYNGKEGTYRGRFYSKEKIVSVLGANSMMGHDIYFDVENKRIGFAESDCDYTQLLVDNNFDVDDVLPPKEAAKIPPPGSEPVPEAAGQPGGTTGQQQGQQQQQHQEQYGDQSQKEGHHVCEDDDSCRGKPFFVAILLVLSLGVICIWRCCFTRGRRYTATRAASLREMELTNGRRYRDNVDGDDDEGGFNDEPNVGFKDEPFNG